MVYGARLSRVSKISCKATKTLGFLRHNLVAFVVKTVYVGFVRHISEFRFVVKTVLMNYLSKESL